MSSITTSALDTPVRRSVERTWDDLAMVVLAAVTLVAGLTFRDYRESDTDWGRTMAFDVPGCPAPLLATRKSKLALESGTPAANGALRSNSR